MHQAAMSSMQHRERHTICHRHISKCRQIETVKTANLSTINRRFCATLIRGKNAANFAEMMPSGMSVPLIQRQYMIALQFPRRTQGATSLSISCFTWGSRSEVITGAEIPHRLSLNFLGTSSRALRTKGSQRSREDIGKQSPGVRTQPPGAFNDVEKGILVAIWERAFFPWLLVI